MRIVEVALVIVGEDFISLCYLLELDLGLLALVLGDLVGMVPKGSLDCQSSKDTTKRLCVPCGRPS